MKAARIILIILWGAFCLYASISWANEGHVAHAIYWLGIFFLVERVYSAVRAEI